MTLWSTRPPVSAEVSGEAPVTGGRAERVRQRAQRRFYPEVQALRAVAIGMVLLFHYGSGLFATQGSFVGVDVFFVISGFLISSHLIAEVDRTGSVRLPAFYARRARRLLPASLSVLFVVAIGSVLLLPRGEWGLVGRAIVTAAFYGFNLFAAAEVARDPGVHIHSLPSVHYWSLSAEEQFYLVWPPLILLAVAIAAALRRRGRTVGTVSAIGVTLAIVASISFVWSVAWTLADPRIAYFMTPTRVWEFAAGGLVTIVLRRWAPTEGTATVLRWIGLVLILPGSLLLAVPDVLPGPGVLAAPDAFPGPMALPAVLGTALVIIAGGTRRGTFMDAVVRWRPVQWLGLISYSVYLWHWPLIPFAEAAWGGIGAPRRLLLLGLSLLLGHVWQKWVEDASRYIPGLKQNTRASLWLALAGMLAIGAVGAALAYAGT